METAGVEPASRSASHPKAFYMLNPFFDNAAKEKPGKTSFGSIPTVIPAKKPIGKLFLRGALMVMKPYRVPKRQNTQQTAAFKLSG